MTPQKPLTDKEWGSHYNINILDSVVHSVQHKNFSIQTQEMLSITKENDKVLEIGCGSGASSLALAAHNRKATALDYADECVSLVRSAAVSLGVALEVYHHDAMQTLPFCDNEFDVIFHAGLLEHFEIDDRIKLLANWSRVGKKMVSLVPNAASLAYRVGKADMERKGTWSYGLEIPIYSQHTEFTKAGLRVLQEYTIGASHALEFLSKWHPLRIVLRHWLKHNFCGDNCGQGYLLVTIGEKF
jgi:ubiquinone/menaquinone biosynthesis C-methylase UbiE